MNRYSFFEAVDGNTLIFDNVVDWFKMQQKAIENEIAEDFLPFVTDCILMSTKKNSLGYMLRGEGKLTFDTDGLLFEGIRDNTPFTERFSIKTQTAITHDAGIWGIDFAGEDCNYALCPTDSRKMIKIVEMYSALRRKLTEAGMI
jgi:hypothetical protein